MIDKHRVLHRIHQPLFIAVIAVLIAGCMHRARLRAVGRVCISTNFNFENMQGCSITRLEKVIEDLTAVWFGVVVEETRVATTTADGTDTIKDSATILAVKCNVCVSGGLDSCKDKPMRVNVRIVVIMP